MKTSEEIKRDILSRFEEKIKDHVAYGGAIDLFTSALAVTLEEVYEEIERSKNPHVWTKLEGKYLDATGTWVNLPRNLDESDESYKYRLMNWLASAEASNTTAITNALLNPTHARNITYIPFTKGCGTGTCYVLPKEYTKENMEKALEESKHRLRDVVSPSLHIEYIIPQVRPVILEVYLAHQGGDTEELKRIITEEVRYYIHSLPPSEYLSLGKINSIGMAHPSVQYFSVISLILDGVPTNKVRMLQDLESKFILDTIRWLDASEGGEV